MKRIDVESAITKYMSNNNFRIVDILSKDYSISSYEQYIECFSLIYNIYPLSLVSIFTFKSNRFSSF